MHPPAGADSLTPGPGHHITPFPLVHVLRPGSPREPRAGIDNGTGEA